MADGDAEGLKIMDGYIEVSAKVDKAKLQREVGEGVDSAAPRAREKGRTSLGRGMLSGIKEAFAGGFSNAISFGLKGTSGVASSFASNPYVAAIGAALAAAILATTLPAIGAGLAAGVGLGAGAGIIGLGAFLVREDPKVQKAAQRLGGTFSKTFTKAARPFIKPVVGSLNILNNLVKDIGPDFRQMFAMLAPMVKPLTEGFADMVRNALPGLKELIAASLPLISTLTQFLPRFGEAFSMFFSDIAGGGEGANLFLTDFLTLILGTIVGLGQLIGWLSRSYVAVRGFITSLPGWLKQAGDWFGRMGDKVSSGFSAVITWFEKLPGRVGDYVSSIPGRLKSMWQEAFSASVYAVGFGIGSTIGLVASLPGKTWGAISATPGKVKSMWLSTWAVSTAWAGRTVDDTVAWFKGLPGKAGGALSGLKDSVLDKLKGAGSWLYQAGRDIISGLVNGIKSALSTALNAIKDAAGDIKDGFKDALGIHSPSTVMAKEVGAWIPPGIAQGIQDSRGSLMDAMGSLVPEMASQGRQGAAETVRAGGGVTIQNLNIQGVWDFSDPAAVRRLIATLFDLLRRYEKGYA